jgi:hypothetical protein
VARLADRNSQIDDDDTHQIWLGGVELMGVRDHGTGARNGRRKAWVDVVGGRRVVAAVRIGGNQFPAVGRSATARQFDAVDVPSVIGVVIAEQVERHLREHGRVAAIATDHGIRAAARADPFRRLGQLDLATVRTITQPYRARPLVAFGRRWAGVHHEAAVTRHRRVGTRLRFEGNGGCLCERRRQRDLGRCTGEAQGRSSHARNCSKQPATNSW